MSPSPPLARLLLATADAVAGVRAGRSLTELLERTDPALRPAVRALASTVLRRLGAATAVRRRLAAKAPPAPIDALLLCALALLWPAPQEAAAYDDHTLVNQAVHAARLKVPTASGFVNAVLRRFVRERAAIVDAVEHEPEAAYNHPLWWIERVRHDWPRQWQALLRAADTLPPLVLRVNARRTSAAAYVQKLAAHGIAAHALGAQAVWCPQPRPVAELPGFGEGEVSVQDLSAQRAAPLLLGADLRPGARVLDACAAPGGKTAHLLELAELELTALDADAARLQRVRETLERLHLSAPGTAQDPARPPQGSSNVAAPHSHERVRLVCADAREVARWWDGRPFDAVLLDAPCTASGIVRRHPDIRWLRRPDDLVSLPRLQAELLDALWPLVASGGVLLYATCSIFRVEGEQQIDAFLQRHAADAPRLEPTSPGHLLPLPDNSESQVAAARVVGDGFFYALMRKP